MAGYMPARADFMEVRECVCSVLNHMCAKHMNKQLKWPLDGSLLYFIETVTHAFIVVSQ